MTLTLVDLAIVVTMMLGLLYLYHSHGLFGDSR